METLKIIYVEDSRVDVYLLEEACKQKGLESDIVVFDDGEKAIEYFKQLNPSTAHFTPDVLIVDYILPWRNGYDVIREVRSRSALNKIPILLFTSHPKDERIDECCEFGALYFQKPLEHSNYSEIINVLLKIAKEEGKKISESPSLAVEI